MNVGIIKYNYNNDILEQICQKLRSYCYLEEHFAIILYKKSYNISHIFSVASVPLFSGIQCNDT